MRTNVHARCSPSREIVPKRRPPRPQQPIFGMFRRGGLRFEHNIPRSRSPRGENGDTRTLTRQKNAPHAAKPLRLSCGSTVNTTTRTQRSPNTFCPSSSHSWLPTFNTDFAVPTCRKFACQQHVASYNPRIGLGMRAERPVRSLARQGFAYVLPEEPGGARPTACCRRRSQGIGWYRRPK